MNEWNKIKLKNKDILFMKRTLVQPNEKVKIETSKPKIKIRAHINKSANKREAKEVIDIIAMDQGNVWGVLQMGILTDGSAILGGRTLNHIEYLPEETEEIVDYNFISTNDAIAVLSEYRGKGKGRQLISIALTLCKVRNINTLHIVGIVSKDAYNFYKATGATMIDEGSAEYDDILKKKI